jgi:diketogulonate reductase-like aldo/keto reductase
MLDAPMPTVPLPSGETIPVLGQGTWELGDDPAKRKDEIASLRLGVDLGMTLIDTAEMYGSGASEELVGEAIANCRDDVFLVSKVLPSNASRKGTIAACERSLQRLGTDRLDLYLLHWIGSVPVQETLEAFQELTTAGKIRYWGVSNFDLADMKELATLTGGEAVATNQVLYNPMRRGIEWDLLPWSRERSIPIMAYSPFDQARLLNEPAMKSVADRHAATPAQVALAWILREGGINVIPRTSSPDHVRENRAALDLELTPEDWTEIDRAFLPPSGRQPLDIL